MCSSFQSHSSAVDYLLEEEEEAILFSAQRFCASSSQISFSQGTTKLCYKDAFKQATVAHFSGVHVYSSSIADDLGDLFDIDFRSLWAQMEDDAHRKSKEGDCETALIESGNVQAVAEIKGRRGGGSSGKELTFEQVSRHFSMPIKQAARELNVGVTRLKKQCRKLGIPRWPHRKMKSLQTLIDNVQVSASLSSSCTKDYKVVHILVCRGQECLKVLESSRRNDFEINKVSLVEKK